MNALLLAIALAQPIPNAKVGGSFSGDVNGNALSNYTNSHESVTAGSGSPNLLTASECGKSIDDIGAAALTYNTLPDAPTAGCFFKFTVTTANGIVVTANTGDTIRLGSYASASAGYVTSTTIGAVLYVESTSATTWVGTITGPGWWSIDGDYSANAGGRYKRTIALTEAILTSSTAGNYGHVDGVSVIPAVSGRRVVFDNAVVIYTFAAAAYTNCTGGVVKYYNGTSGQAVQASELLANVFSASESTNVLITHNDTAVSSGSTSLTDFATGNSLVFNGTACANGASADGTATITVVYHFDE